MGGGSPEVVTGVIAQRIPAKSTRCRLMRSSPLLPPNTAIFAGQVAMDSEGYIEYAARQVREPG